MSIATRALDVALTGSMRIPALMAQATGCIMVGEVALRGCETVAGLFGYQAGRASEKWDEAAPEALKTATALVAKYSGLEYAFGACRPFREMETTTLLASTAAVLIWSTAALEGVSFFFGPPHEMYNKVLQFTSLKLRDQSGIVPFLQTTWAAWNK